MQCACPCVRVLWDVPSSSDRTPSAASPGPDEHESADSSCHAVQHQSHCPLPWHLAVWSCCHVQS